MIVLDGQLLTLDQLLAIAVDLRRGLDRPGGRGRVQAGATVVDEVARGDAPVSASTPASAPLPRVKYSRPTR